MTPPRKPAAFRIEPEPAPRDDRQPTEAPRRPRAVKSDVAIVTPAEIDVFAEPDVAESPPPPAYPPKRRSRLAAIFLGAFGVLVSLAVGLWTDQLIRELFQRAEWLGWLAAGMALVAAAALLIILVREMLALSRLASVEKLRSRALDAIVRDDSKAAGAVVDELSALVASKPDTAAGRRALADLQGEIIDGANLVRIAEAEILGPLDARAKIMVLDAAKRVSLVTAVSPRALVDIAYVVFESGRLIRRLSELYGGRPGTLGFFRLARSVLAHLAVTGAIAAGDDFVHQIVGQGLAARLSAKLGEGVVNGMMTARIGIAAMEAARPLPFTALKRPGIGDFLSALTSFASKKAAGKSPPES
jgi:putative membrane protein